tara:strand:+ start:56 stop:262 length:207 start_codon:yes stop_codon:yes gene_type:complete
MALKVYANEHPKYKKSPKDKHIKLAHHKGNGSVSKDFMTIYNHFIRMGNTPSVAFGKAESGRIVGPRK